MHVIRFSMLSLGLALGLSMPAGAQTLYNTQGTAKSPAPVAQQQSRVAAPVSTPVTAPAKPQGVLSNEALQFGKAAGAACPGKWDSPECLAIISQNNLMMAANYGGALKENGKVTESELIKEHCAAATAAREKSFPAYAMKSAFTECANTIVDVSGKTGISPDLSEYQLLVGATLCLGNDPRCGTISDQLKQLATR